MRALVMFLQRLILGLSKTWYWFALAFPILFLMLGFLAPALMAEGETDTARAVYRFLAANNHQLPERSYFLFGEDGRIHTYTRAELLAAGADPANWQAYIGDETVGYKTGLNHRMIAIFVGMVASGLVWGLSRGRLRISLFVFLLTLLPLLLDGLTHMVTDAQGIPFRTENAWAAALTGHAFSAAFYTGTAAGSLNWWLRNITGLLFGAGVVGFLFTRFDVYFRRVRGHLVERYGRKT